MEQSNSIFLTPTTNINLPTYQNNECITILNQEVLPASPINSSTPPSSPNISSASAPSSPNEKPSRKRSRTEIEPSLSDDEEVHTEKKARRRLQNRVAAQNSRLRKKQHIDELEGKNNVLLEENKLLNHTVQSLSSENEKLKQQLIDLHKQLAIKEDSVLKQNSPTVSTPIDHFTPIESAALNRIYSPQMERVMSKRVHLTPRSTTSFIQLMKILNRTISIFLVTLWCLWDWKIYTTQQISQFSAQLQLIYGESVDRGNNNFFEFVYPTRTVEFYFHQRKRKKRKKLQYSQLYNLELLNFIPPVLPLLPSTTQQQQQIQLF